MPLLLKKKEKKERSKFLCPWCREKGENIPLVVSKVTGMHKREVVEHSCNKCGYRFQTHVEYKEPEFPIMLENSRREEILINWIKNSNDWYTALEMDLNGLKGLDRNEILQMVDEGLMIVCHTREGGKLYKVSDLGQKWLANALRRK